MTERKSNTESQQPPADIATLYSWANLHGAKYRDFSETRQQQRAQSRHRMLAEQDAMARAEQDAMARQAAEQVGLDNGGQIPVPEAPVPPPPSVAAAIAEMKTAPIAPSVPAFSAPPALRAAEDRYNDSWQSANAFHPVNSSQQAWFAGALDHEGDAASQNTLQQSREHVASRWFALKGLFDRSEGDLHPVRRYENPVPSLAVFSLAGGVGKTSLVATLGRVLAARGERVLLVDTTAYGLLPFYFGARDLRPNVVRTFSASSEETPISVVSLDTERFGPEIAGQDRMTEQINRDARGSGRVLIDVQTGSLAAMRRLLRLSPTILVPVVPDMNSVATLQALDAFFRSQQNAEGASVKLYYVLNQFDDALPLHLDVREVLRQQLGEHLLPFSIGSHSALNEALAEGMTVVDYAPASSASEDFINLSNWLRSITSVGLRTARWSER